MVFRLGRVPLVLGLKQRLQNLHAASMVLKHYIFQQNKEVRKNCDLQRIFQLLKDIISCLYKACGRKPLTLDPLFLQLLFKFFRVCEGTFGAGVELGRGVFANGVGAKVDRLSRRKNGSEG